MLGGQAIFNRDLLAMHKLRREPTTAADRVAVKTLELRINRVGRRIESTLREAFGGDDNLVGIFLGAYARNLTLFEKHDKGPRRKGDK